MHDVRQLLHRPSGCGLVRQVRGRGDGCGAGDRYRALQPPLRTANQRQDEPPGTQDETWFDCILLDRTSQPGRSLCRVYRARPAQCRGWPFWPENLKDPVAWAEAKRTTPCPGMNSGQLIPADDIVKNLRTSTRRRGDAPIRISDDRSGVPRSRVMYWKRGVTGQRIHTSKRVWDRSSRRRRSWCFPNARSVSPVVAVAVSVSTATGCT